MSMFQNLKQKITLRQATRRTPTLLQIDKKRVEPCKFDLCIEVRDGLQFIRPLGKEQRTV